MAGVAASWERQNERGALWAMRLLFWIARMLGRRVARLVLYPITAYFLLTGRAARAASRDYLRRALQREPGWRDVARHFFTFAAVSLDRVFWLIGTGQAPRVTRHRPDEVYRIQRRGGCLILVAHFGSFEVRHDPSSTQHEVPLRIVLDRAHGRMFTQLLEQTNPQAAKSVIDASQPGPTLMLAIKQALDGGAMVGLMADRARAGERTVTVDFLGGKARLPATPWILAGVLNVPVVIGFGIYRGGLDYDAHFELLAERVVLPRAQRDTAIQAHAQRYADRLAHYVRAAPYNWFNFYDFWAP
ncbi:lipid A biosynthesis acyltransferase [Fontimonas sp. SYSU GA230001]|uniref:LpxL/LpxP family acyltransferase n=1 Tax=Fontimonas sp. SYSU GA230001 TaxID=3142450 RepID=UPI0032B56236